MSGNDLFAEIFVADHAGALKRAAQLAAGSPAAEGAVRINGVGDLEVEELLGLAAGSVHERADVSLESTDITVDELFTVPAAGVRVLEELPGYTAEDGENVLDAVAEEWANQEDTELDVESAKAHVRELGRLAASVDLASAQNLYVWAVPISIG